MPGNLEYRTSIRVDFVYLRHHSDGLIDSLPKENDALKQLLAELRFVARSSLYLL